MVASPLSSTLVTMANPHQKVLVSACLLGRECRYDARHNRDEQLEDELAERGQIPVPFCPEEEGGLPTPRPAAWIEKSDAGAVLIGQDRLVTGEGTDVTDAFVRGAQRTLERCKELHIQVAYLKERSPSCGVETTHVDGQAVAGPGVTAELLGQAGIELHGVQGKRQRK